MRALFFSSLLAAASCLSAQITWETTASSQEADLFAKDLLYTFHGKNTGTETIKIKSLRASCPCLEVSSDKAELAPGDELLVVAQFNPNDVGGAQRQRIAVFIEGQERPDRLTVTAELPETVTVSPKRLYWKSNSISEAQEVELILSDDTELLDVYAMDENFSTTLSDHGQGRYTVTVTPEDLTIQRPAMVMLRYKTNNRELRQSIPCVIADKNPFKISFQPNPTMTTDMGRLESGLIRQGQIEKSQIPSPIPSNPSPLQTDIF